MISSMLLRKIQWRLFGGRKSIATYRALLNAKPLDADRHFKFARSCFSKGNFPLAIAEAKTAIALGRQTPDAIRLIQQARVKSEPLLSMDHNTYYRFISLQQVIEKATKGSHDYSILDVGGGEGGLAQFLPTNRYCLAEPEINGISGTALPFENRSFDVVTSCHVLEHIPPNERHIFLDQLCSKAKKSVILLNPFQLDGIDETKRLQLHLNITNAPWAKEHLACSLPSIKLISDFARDRGYDCEIAPNGSLALSFASVYIDYFARKAGAWNDLAKVNAFMNESFSDIAVSDRYPNAYIAHIKVNS